VAFLLPITLLLCAVAGTYFYLNQRMKRSEAYERSLTLAYNSPDVQKVLGADIHQKGAVVGHLETFEGAEFAEWSVPLVGSNGSGHLFGIANRVKGTWDYARLVLRSDDGKGKVNLTPVHAVSLPEVPARAVYLVPIGLEESL